MNTTRYITNHETNKLYTKGELKIDKIRFILSGETKFDDFIRFNDITTTIKPNFGDLDLPFTPQTIECLSIIEAVAYWEQENDEPFDFTCMLPIPKSKIDDNIIHTTDEFILVDMRNTHKIYG